MFFLVFFFCCCCYRWSFHWVTIKTFTHSRFSSLRCNKWNGKNNKKVHFHLTESFSPLAGEIRCSKFTALHPFGDPPLLQRPKVGVQSALIAYFSVARVWVISVMLSLTHLAISTRDVAFLPVEPTTLTAGKLSRRKFSRLSRKSVTRTLGKCSLFRLGC